MGNRKIALVTCYFQHNYGSQLQAYATQLLFDKLGVENETICIDGLQKEINRAKYKYFLSKFFSANMWVDKMGTIRKFVLLKTKGRKYIDDLQKREEMFQEFANTMFHLSEQYDSKEKLSECAYQYIAFVVGSDQLWLPSNIDADYYTLNFVPKDICRISFATSFGVSVLPKKQKLKASIFLEKFDYISVREKSGVKMIKELINRDIPIVCDPTLMFTADEWSAILPKKRFYGEPYIFCYLLGHNPKQRKFIKMISKYTGLKVVQIQYWNDIATQIVGFPDHAPYNVGPKEFIQLIRDADFVFTDSFHCSVFSMLFSRTFFTFKRYSNDSSISTNGRIYSLLSLVHQESRLLSADEDIETILNMNIDYDVINKELFELRKFSYNWLTDCLAKIRYQND